MNRRKSGFQFESTLSSRKTELNLWKDLPPIVLPPQYICAAAFWWKDLVYLYVSVSKLAADAIPELIHEQENVLTSCKVCECHGIQSRCLHLAEVCEMQLILRVSVIKDPGILLSSADIYDVELIRFKTILKKDANPNQST